jgi:asparagine synthase (glutamine-hydrolysing)
MRWACRGVRDHHLSPGVAATITQVITYLLAIREDAAGELDLAVARAALGAAFDDEAESFEWRDRRFGDRIQLLTATLPATSIAPFRSIDEDDRGALLLDGVAVSRDPALAGHDAASLRKDIDHLAERLEGRFAIVCIDASTSEASILTDPLGFQPVYRTRLGGHVLVSNRLAALRALVPPRLDPLAAAAFVTLGHPLGGRSLDEGVEVLGGGAWHRLPTGATDRHFVIEPRAVRRDADAVAGEAARELAACLVGHFTRFRDTTCQLTGGQDSRLVLALALLAGLRPRCVTRGAASDPDVRLAALAAKAAGCDHEVAAIDRSAIERDAERIASRLLVRTEGAVSLWQLADVANERHVAGVATTLGGIGGEIARRYWPGASLLDRSLDGDALLLRFAQRLIGKAGYLLTSDARAALHTEIVAVGREFLDAGHAAVDVPDLFYATQRVRRWGGANARKLPARRATLPPLVMRPFLAAAFGLTAEARARSSLHQSIVRDVCPKLFEAPLLDAAWEQRPRRFAALRDRFAPETTVPSRDPLIGRLAALRGAALLDRGDAAWWATFDRAAVERALAAANTGGLDTPREPLAALLTLAWS